MRSPIRHVALAATAAALFIAGAAAAQTPGTGVFKDGAELYPLCTSSQSADIQICEWYLMGAYDMAKYYDDTSGNHTFCTPTGTVNAARVRELVVAHLRDNPDHRRFSASSVLRHVLVQNYPPPCRPS